jgi:hypothetical protein
MRVHGVLCALRKFYARSRSFMLAQERLCVFTEFYARSESFMPVHGVLCSRSEIYARHSGFMLAIRDLCSLSRFYARHPGFMLAIRDLCSPSIHTKQKNTAGATLQCFRYPLDEASALKINHSLKHEISFLDFYFCWFQFPCHFIYNKL